MHVPRGVIRPQPASVDPRPHDASLVAPVATAVLPTRHGSFTTHVFRGRAHAGDQDGGLIEKEHVALVFGDVVGQRDVLVRVHSECITSEVFGSLKCDCKEQLDAAMAEIARHGSGVIVYLRQEGRGIGLANKIRAYELQSRGHDTVDANRLLGLPDDARRYDIARDVLGYLGVKSVRLMTNNPEKVAQLRALGVKVAGRAPVVIAPNPFSAGYLETKRARMSHELPRRSLEAERGSMARAANGDAE